MAWEEAVTGWYENVYLPLVKLIREKDLLKEFPHRTEADLYAWLTRYELDLRRLYDVSDVDDEFVVKDFSDQYSERPVVSQLKTVYRTILRLFGRKRPPPEMVSPYIRPGYGDADAAGEPAQAMDHPWAHHAQGFVDELLGRDLDCCRCGRPGWQLAQ